MQEFEITLETAPEKTELVLIPEQTNWNRLQNNIRKITVTGLYCMCRWKTAGTFKSGEGTR